MIGVVLLLTLLSLSANKRICAGVPACRKYIVKKKKHG